MLRALLAACCLLLSSQALANLENGNHIGMVIKRSYYSVQETLDRLEQVARDQDFAIAGRIDYQVMGDKAGLNIRPCQVLLFGKPSLGTSMVQSNPLAALELPFRAIAWEDEDGKVFLGYFEPHVVAERYMIEDKSMDVNRMSRTLDQLTANALSRLRQQNTAH